MSGVLTIPELLAKKKRKEKITALTAYDYCSARMADLSGVDIILVGDSLGMVVLGYETTIPVNMDEMIHHTCAAVRGVTKSVVIADMPYLSYHISRDDAVRNAGRFIKECGAKAVKLEGASDNILEIIEYLGRAQIPVMGHIGLTPQSVNVMGGFKVQGRNDEGARRIIEEAKALEASGVFSIVLEGIPAPLAGDITSVVSVPTIGIGAGPCCDGQILVYHDMLGMNDKKIPKFVKQYASLNTAIKEAISNYCREVREGSFPGDEHCY